MSAWYVFSAMGFYPVNPVGGEYEIGTPLYPEVRMRLSNGKTFTALAHGVSGKNRYVRSVKLDGKPYDKSYITHEQIMNGSIPVSYTHLDVYKRQSSGSPVAEMP